MKPAYFLIGLISATLFTTAPLAAATTLDRAAQAVEDGGTESLNKARELLEAAPRDDTLSPEDVAIARHNLGRVQVLLEDYPAAVAQLDAAIRSGELTERQRAVAHVNRGIAYRNLAHQEADRKNLWKSINLARAEQDFTTAIELDRSYIDAYQRRAQARREQLRTQEAAVDDELAAKLADEYDGALFGGGSRNLLIDRSGLLLGNKLEWLLGGLIVFIYAYRRFNTPKTFTASTTLLKYHFAGVAYYLSSLLLFLLIASLLAQSPNLLAVLGVQEAALPADLQDLSGPLLTALLLTSLLPHAPMLSQIDESLLSFFRRMGQIPIAAAILGGQLRRMGIKIPEKSYRRGYAEAIDVKRQVVRFVERNLKGVSEDDLVFEESPCLAYKITSAIWLFDEIRSWESNPAYRRVFDLFTPEIRQFKKKFDKLMALAARYFEFQRDIQKNGNGEERSRALAEIEDHCEDIYDDLFKDMCDLLARAVLRREFSAADRKFKLAQVGFYMPGPSLSLDNLIGIGLMIFIIMFTCMSILGAMIQEQLVSRVLVIASMVTVIYLVAIACAILPKTSWAFADIRRRRTRPFAAYLLSAVLAVAVGVVVSILFKAIHQQDFYSAVLEVKYTYPWFYLSFVLTLTVAFLADSHVVPPSARPFWLRLARKLSNLGNGPTAAESSGIVGFFLRKAGQAASYWGGERARYLTRVPPWILAAEAALAALIMGLTMLLAYEPLKALDASRPLAGEGHLFQLPPLVVPFVANTLIGFVIALFVPYFHRRSLEISSGSRSESGGEESAMALGRETIRDIPLFRALEAEAFEQIWQSATLHHFPAETPVLHRGAPGLAVYILVSGMVRAQTCLQGARDLHIATFHAGDIFGEQSLFNGGEIQADVTALQNCRVVKIGKEAFRAVFNDHPAAVGHVVHALAEAHLRKAALVAAEPGESEGALKARYESRICAVFDLEQQALDLDGGSARVSWLEPKVASS